MRSHVLAEIVPGDFYFTLCFCPPGSASLLLCLISLSHPGYLFSPVILLRVPTLALLDPWIGPSSCFAPFLAHLPAPRAFLFRSPALSRPWLGSSPSSTSSFSTILTPGMSSENPVSPGHPENLLQLVLCSWTRASSPLGVCPWTLLPHLPHPLATTFHGTHSLWAPLRSISGLVALITHVLILSLLNRRFLSTTAPQPRGAAFPHNHGESSPTAT